MKTFSGSVKVKVAVGMKARINPLELEGQLHDGKEFVIAGDPNVICGIECVPLNHLDGTRFSANYDLSMLQITDTDTGDLTVRAHIGNCPRSTGAHGRPFDLATFGENTLSEEDRKRLRSIGEQCRRSGRQNDLYLLNFMEYPPSNNTHGS